MEWYVIGVLQSLFSRVCPSVSVELHDKTIASMADSLQRPLVLPQMPLRNHYVLIGVIQKVLASLDSIFLDQFF